MSDDKAEKLTEAIMLLAFAINRASNQFDNFCGAPTENASPLPPPVTSPQTESVNHPR